MSKDQSDDADTFGDIVPGEVVGMPSGLTNFLAESYNPPQRDSRTHTEPTDSDE